MDILTPERRSALMSRIRGKDTKPELAVRRIAHALGYRFRLHRRDLPGAPDLIFPRLRKAIFVHGCFWHSHPGCPRAKRPATRTEFWNNKLDRNVLRDASNIAFLEAKGWKVFIVWECQTGDLAKLGSALKEFASE